MKVEPFGVVYFPGDMLRNSECIQTSLSQAQSGIGAGNFVSRCKPMVPESNGCRPPPVFWVAENRSLRGKLTEALEGVREKQEAERQTDKVVRELQVRRRRPLPGIGDPQKPSVQTSCACCGFKKHELDKSKLLDLKRTGLARAGRERECRRNVIVRSETPSVVRGAGRAYEGGKRQPKVR